MRFSYGEVMCDPQYYISLAKEAENAGFHSFVIPDNLGFPASFDTSYPYAQDGDNAFLEDKPFIEPFTLIPALGAVTQTLRFTTLVVKLPVRPVYLVAKQATSVAVITNNRFAFGVGLSPWPQDFSVCNQDWETRGPRMDEMIEIIRGFAAGGYYEFHGEHYDIEKFKMCPVPTQAIPILIGGHSEAGLKRAARTGDGWMHAGGDPQELERLLQRLNELRRQYGRHHLPFEVHAIPQDPFDLDGIKRLAELGVTDAVVQLRNVYGPDTQNLIEKIDLLRKYADQVIGHFR
ncbi:MAG: TIGR03619 family F420-dependent LLM class oxidoreductase [Halieaceae bacterium]|jgi:probable F420-dependent oxidoreductase|nr:TIGR03619 family F420-dependent LLM class oxidoreductase [Halieaceae bacterium]